MPTKRNPPLYSLLALTLGVLVFAGGVVLARAWLAKWHTGRLPEPGFYAGRFRELTGRAGARLAPGEPRVSFHEIDESGNPEASRLEGGLSPDAVTALGGGLIVQARQQAALPGAGKETRELVIDFLPSGEPWALRWGSTGETIHTSIQGKRPLGAAQQGALIQLLLRPGERLRNVPSPASPAGKSPADQTVSVSAGGESGAVTSTEPILGSRPPQQMLLVAPPGGSAVLVRQLDSTEHRDKGSGTKVAEILLEASPLLLGILTAVILFLVLLGKRRIDFVNGAGLGAFLVVVSAVPVLVADPSWSGALSIVGTLFIAAWAFLLWSAGESLLRAIDPGVAVDLDALRAGRLGPRGGRSLVDGVAVGALLAGLQLAALALAAHLPGAWPEKPPPHLPVFSTMTPFFTGVVLAAGAAIALGLALRFLPSRWASWAAALAAGLAVPLVSLRPLGWQVAVSVAAAGLLIVLGRRDGLAALLTAAACSALLPAAAFSALHLTWLPWTFAVSAGVPLLLLGAGVAGLRRPEEAERERLKPPAFIRRLEEERRISYEMDLLARMQLGLLPSSLPVVPGWEIAVRSLLATEAGGDLYDFLSDEEGNLWIAAGDVAGHGYSCAIVQAMTSAALTSIITAERTPSEVLQGVDRVIRRGGSHRNFTSLALVRLNPETGGVTMSNAGHPFPLLLAHGGDVEEISLPGLPLGQGPQRQYADFSFDIPRGGALVFCSDGLFEATDP
ncbi:MAG TPA: SpoIIE family protein phosphatase, partial [Thermoanaerobaculia bacterium]|nr:SpoIIE family protein phosphatase [Thermoanaerobaculia bacterium]